jgi:hypothetical protein
MREAHEVYLLHHWHCPTCCAAGQRYGQRCAEGARLWDAYNEAAQRERADRESTKQAAPELPAPDPRLSWSDCLPATAAEIVRMAERTEAFERMGLTPDEVDWAVDRLLRRDRDLDDRHLCIECQRVRASGVGWRCAALGPIPTDWVTRQLQRCAAFEGPEHE